MIKTLSLCSSALVALMLTCTSLAGITSDAVSYYRLDGNTADNGSNRLHGTMFGGSFTTDRFGSPDSALLLDGVNDYVRIADAPGQNLTGDLTVASWVYIPSPGPTYGRIIFSNMLEVSPHDGFSLRFMGSTFGNKLRFLSGSSVISTNPLPLDEWVHVAATVAGDRASLWINGTFEGSASVRVPTLNTVDQGIGASYTPFYFFDGAIDDVALFDRSLSPQDIRELMAVPEPGSIATLTALMTLRLLHRRRN